MRVFGGEEEGGGVRSGPGAARTILLFHTISARPSKQPHMVGSTLGVYSFGLIFVSARTNKRHHHQIPLTTSPTPTTSTYFHTPTSTISNTRNLDYSRVYVYHTIVGEIASAPSLSHALGCGHLPFYKQNPGLILDCQSVDERAEPLSPVASRTI